MSNIDVKASLEAVHGADNGRFIVGKVLDGQATTDALESTIPLLERGNP